MGHYEKEWLSNYNDFSPSYYARHIDDIFSIFNLHDEAKRFFCYLHSRHSNIKFAVKTEVKTKSFTFWISLLIIITTFWNVYLKSTYSDILVNFNSFTFLLYKISLVKCLVDHAYKKHNAWASFHVNIDKIKKNVTLFFNIFDRQNYKILFGKNAS